MELKVTKMKLDNIKTMYIDCNRAKLLKQSVCLHVHVYFEFEIFFKFNTVIYYLFTV